MHTGRNDARVDTSLELLLASAPRDGTPRVLATVVATAGSTYRKPGARMLVMEDGRYFGLLSGGCLEADLIVHARRVLDGGVARTVEYDMRGPDDVLFGVGAGCKGAMRILLEPAAAGSPAAAALLEAGRASRAGRATALVVVHESSEGALGTYAVTAAPSAALAAAGERALADTISHEIVIGTGELRSRAFVQYLAPRPHLLICGAAPDAQPVASAALVLGWQVTVVDHRPALAVAERFPGAEVRSTGAAGLLSGIPIESCHAAVVMSHHLASDAAYLRELAKAGMPPYVGLLGPAARRQRIAKELGCALSEKQWARIHGPVGIDIGAVTPEGIALAIVSQIHARLAGRGSMRSCDGSLMDDYGFPEPRMLY